MISTQKALVLRLPSRRSLRRSRRGFTLVELLVVMAVILILMSMIVGVAIFANAKATRSRATAELQEFQNALQSYRIETGEYPPAGQFRQAVYPRLPKDIQSRVDKRSRSILQDPWKRQYIYQFDENQPETYVLYSKGPKDTIDTDDLRPGQ
jgi:general secretion pathway protein G